MINLYYVEIFEEIVRFIERFLNFIDGLRKLNGKFRRFSKDGCLGGSGGGALEALEII